MKFTEEKLEQAIIELLVEQGYEHINGDDIDQENEEQVLIKTDIEQFLRERYRQDNITASEITNIIDKLENLPASDLYDSNKKIMHWLADGFVVKREDDEQQDLYIQLIDYEKPANNSYKIVNQLTIVGDKKRTPDAIIYINGLPLVVFEFKSAIREEATIEDAYKQLTNRYIRDIPELFKYNALAIISDGVNNKMGSLFAAYEFYYSWSKVTGDETLNKDGIDSLFTMMQGLFNKKRLLGVMHNFIYFPDTSSKEEKIVCRYPQYYAATKLLVNIKQHLTYSAVNGDGKGGTYSGATGCGKSYCMLFLTRLLMKDLELSSPTIILITDRTDLDDQLAGKFTNAKQFIGDDTIISVASRAELRELLKGRNSGGVFLTTIQKFSEDLELLTDRSNVICISDEAHRSQNLEQKVTATTEGIKKSYGFAKYLRDSLPNATYVGFTGTHLDATIEVFGNIVDRYTMMEAVLDEITVKIVYEGRAAEIYSDERQLEEIENYYKECEAAGANEYQVEKSKKTMAVMANILSNPQRIKAIANDFINHYEKRINEGSSQKGCALVVCYNREIAYQLYQEIIKLRPEWNQAMVGMKGIELSEYDKKTIKPMERIKMVMTRHRDDDKTMYNLLGSKDYRKELDRQFKNVKSNFKIAIVVDMWTTGFDVPFLDTIYIDKPIQKHNLIQTISRVNRRFETKESGLVVDYIGIKKKMDGAIKDYTGGTTTTLEDIEKAVVIVKDQLSLLDNMFYKFDSKPYFTGNPLEQLRCLNNVAEFVQQTKKFETDFMALVKPLKSAYDICTGSKSLSQTERDKVYYYLAVRTIVFKITKGNAPDITQMNNKVKQLIEEALQSSGVTEIIKFSADEDGKLDIYNEEYLAKIAAMALPRTKFQLLEQLLAKGIQEFKKINKLKGIDFTKKMNALIEKYNQRNEHEALKDEIISDLSEQMINLYKELGKEANSFHELGIDIEEKAFYDILQSLTKKYDFSFPEDKLLDLAKQVKQLVDNKDKYTDWYNRSDIKAELQFDLIKLLDKNGYPPVPREEVYQDVFEQAESFKRNRIKV